MSRWRRIQTRCSDDALDRLRDAVAAAQAAGAPITLEEAADMGMRLAAQCINDRYNGGKRTPRSGPLPPGRPSRARRAERDRLPPLSI